MSLRNSSSHFSGCRCKKTTPVQFPKEIRYIWELFMTCDFEWSLITRKRKPTWPFRSLFACSAFFNLTFGQYFSFSVATLFSQL